MSNLGKKGKILGASSSFFMALGAVQTFLKGKRGFIKKNADDDGAPVVKLANGKWHRC